MSLYLRNATWIDPETFKARATTIKVEEGPFGGMALDAHAPAECPPEDAVLDCTGRLVMPSFGCGHHHIYSALARGMPPAPKARRTSLRCWNTSGGAWTKSSITT